MDGFVNCHTHIFAKECIPPRFLPLFIAWFLSRIMRRKWLAHLLMWLNPFSKNDIFNRIANLLAIASLPGQSAVFRRLSGFYPEGTRFVVLSMDMDHMGAGNPRKKYTDQLEGLIRVRDTYPESCLPFVCADPRNGTVFNLVKEYIEVHGFRGIKIYPPYGFFPYDPGLDRVYEYAQANGVPVLTHCAPASFVYRGWISRTMRTDPLSGEKLPWRRKKLADLWVHPANYRIVMMRYPRLKLCLAHFGGIPAWGEYLDTPWNRDDEESWFSIVLDLIRAYPNVYADVSYTVHKPQYFPLLKVVLQDARIRPKVLYGSDYYMEEVGASERRYAISLRGYLGEADFRQIAEINPAAFLG